MGILLCEQNFRDVWRRNKSVGQKFVKFCAHTHKHTHAAKLVVRICQKYLSVCRNSLFSQQDIAPKFPLRPAPIIAAYGDQGSFPQTPRSGNRRPTRQYGAVCRIYSYHLQPGRDFVASGSIFRSASNSIRTIFNDPLSRDWVNG